MAVHQARINFANLIKDLAEMYPNEVPEVVLVELVANCLDAGATTIRVNYDPQANILVVEDNGKGMTERQFEEYHDFAAGLKTRGDGIGFAGVGAKISFNIADRVVTETRSRDFVGGSNWYMQSSTKLAWEDVEPINLLSGFGTRVEVNFKAGVIPSYSSSSTMEKLLKRHYLPLFEDTFLSIYAALKVYSKDLRFVVNGRIVEPEPLVDMFDLRETKTFTTKSGNKRTGYGSLGLSATEYPLEPESPGVFISTRGKVVKAELFNQFPGQFGSQIMGLVEVPGLVQFLTTNKCDFIRGRGKNREFSRLYDPVRAEFVAWLKALGVQVPEPANRDDASILERELRQLVNDVPELAEFFGPTEKRPVLALNDGADISANLQEGQEGTFPAQPGHGRLPGPGLVAPGDYPGESLVETDQDGQVKAAPISRRARGGIKVSFESRPEQLELAWVNGNGLVVNSGHSAYEKAQQNAHSRTTHSLFAIATAMARFLMQNEVLDDPRFVDRMMQAWGSK